MYYVTADGSANYVTADGSACYVTEDHNDAPAASLDVTLTVTAALPSSPSGLTVTGE